MARERKFIPVGTQYDNECCTCCDTCWSDQAQDITDHNTEHRCCHYEGIPGEGEEQEIVYDHSGACPFSCCACPPTGNLCLTLNVQNLAGGTICDGPGQPNGMEFTLKPDRGVAICSGQNPITHVAAPWDHGGEMCYNEALDIPFEGLMGGIQRYGNDFEKWGWCGTICSGLVVPDCEILTKGEKLEISLCCCDTVNSDVRPTYTDQSDCHTCSYRLTFTWYSQYLYAEGEMCSCPDEGTHFDIKVTPTCDDVVGVLCGDPNLDFAFVDGQCSTGNPSPGRDFVLDYIVDEPAGGGGARWWHCDCCQNGDTVNDNDVVLLATVTDLGSRDENCEDGEPAGAPHCTPL